MKVRVKTLTLLMYTVWMYIIIEESGQFSKKSKTKNFVIGAFGVSNIKYSYNKISAWFKDKFVKEKYRNEIKWSSEEISDTLRLKTLTHIKGLEIEIQYVHINNKEIPLSYYNLKGLESGKLYVDLIIQVLKKFNLKSEDLIHIFCDNRSLKNIPTNQFKKFLLRYLYDQYGTKKTIHIDIVTSHTHINIQIADWITGAISRYLEKGHLWKEIGQILELDN